MTTEDAELVQLLEEADRREARRSFLTFYERMTGFTAPRHIKAICKLLQSMEEDRCDRAMIFAPPRHGKTLLTSILFPAWLMGRRPESYIMSISHTADYALTIGGKVRNLLKQPEWPFSDVGLSEDSQAKDRWRTRAGGEMNTFGALAGNQHGRAAEWLGMDDVVKGREMALSPDMRNKVWDNYIADMRTRLQGRAKQVMTFTRWHQDDPAGRILPEDWSGESGWIKDRETGEPWYVLSMPAQWEGGRDVLGRQPGEWLWPEHFGESKLAGMRARGGWFWSALYQQRPSPEEGLLFRSEHFQPYDPSTLDRTRLAIYGSSDYAVRDEAGKADPDWTVHLVWGVDPDMNIYLLDIWRGRTESDVWALAWIALVQKWKPVRWAEEGGVINLAVSPTLRRLMHEKRVYVERVKLQSLVSKEARAQPLLSWCGLGRVFLPDAKRLPAEKQMHMNAMMQELMQFPGGKHDDTVDAATLMGRMLDRIQGGEARTVHKSPHRYTIHDAFKAHEEQLERRARR